MKPGKYYLTTLYWNFFRMMLNWDVLNQIHSYLCIWKFWLIFLLFVFFSFSKIVSGIVTLQIEKSEDDRKKYCFGKTY